MRRFNDKEDKIEYILEAIEINDDIAVVCDYETVISIYNGFSDVDYEYVGLDLQSDVEEYLVEIIKGECLAIEPLKRKDGFFYAEGNLLLIDNEILKNNKNLLNYFDYEEIEILNVGTEKCECQCSDNCQGWCDDECEDCKDDEIQEFTVNNLCSYVLINKLDNCKTMEEEIEVLKELYEIGFDDGYKLAIQTDIEAKMEFLDELDS